jgi:hypothetical protein
VQAAVAVVGGRRLPAAEEERDPGLDVLAAGLIGRFEVAARWAAKPPTASRSVSMVRGDLLPARRYRSKERARSSSLGAAIASPAVQKADAEGEAGAKRALC